ncbi:MAG: 7TM domain-containing protein [bacterium]
MPEVTQWLVSRGISETILMIVAYIPLIVTITSISRYMLGIKTSGIYSSMILSLAYYFMGLRQGLIITFIVLVSAWLLRYFFRKVQMHYLSRLAIVYGGVSIFILFFIIGTSFIRSEDPFFDFTALPALPLAMIISITDRFISNYIKKDLIGALRLTVETILIALFGWILIRSYDIQTFLINNLWIVPLTIVINLFIGRYSGFRLTEIARFGQILKAPQTTPENEK